MSIESRMAIRVGSSFLLTIAGWGLAITAVVMFVTGRPGAGAGFVVGAVAAMGVSAYISKRKSLPQYAAEQQNRAIAFLRQRQYSLAQAEAQKTVGIMRSGSSLLPGLPIALVVLATARAANGDIPGARRDLGEAHVVVRDYPAIADVVTALGSILERELRRGVPDVDALVREVLDA